VITEGAGLIRRPAVQEHREPGKQQRQCIRGVMAGIGYQREAVRTNPRQQFENDKRAGGEERPDQNASRGVPMGTVGALSVTMVRMQKASGLILEPEL